MIQRLKTICKALATVLAGLVASGLSSCSMMEEDPHECPDGLFVRFVYDYNIQRADMFKDHVGHVRVYVYDESGRKVAERQVSNTADDAPLAEYGYAMHFTPDEVPPGRYRIVALGMQRDWDDAQQTVGARYRHPEHTQAEALTVSLDHEATPSVEGMRHRVEHHDAPMDTLWHTLKVMASDPINGTRVPPMPKTTAPYNVPLTEQYVTVQAQRATYATVSLIRDTKHLSITLRQLDDRAAMQHATYDVSIADDNAHLAHDNSIIKGTPLHYTPYAAWTTRFGSGGVEIDRSPSARAEADVQERTAHYNLMFNRIIKEADPKEGGILTITNRETGVTVATINLPNILSEGRSYHEYGGYQEQEYLDREYDYHLDFFLRGDKWEYVDIHVNVLSWSKRKYNIEL